MPVVISFELWDTPRVVTRRNGAKEAINLRQSKRQPVLVADQMMVHVMAPHPLEEQWQLNSSVRNVVGKFICEYTSRYEQGGDGEMRGEGESQSTKISAAVAIAHRITSTEKKLTNRSPSIST